MAISFFALILPLVMGKDWRLFAPDLFRDEGCDEERERQGWEYQRVQMLVYSFTFYMAFMLFLIFR